MNGSAFILACVIFLQISLLADSAMCSPPVKLPQTGQTLCYDAIGTVIECVGTGQDGDVLAGIAPPSPRFADNGDQTVTDLLTGLIWAKDGNVLASRDPGFDTNVISGITGDGIVSWQIALNYIKKLNQEAYLGFSDWRLPNGFELASLVDSGSYYPALSAGNPFVNVQGHFYWSSTSGTSYPAGAWTVTTGGEGRFFGFSKLVQSIGNVWPVRGSTGTTAGFIAKTGQVKCYDEGGSEISCAGTGQDGEFQFGVAWASPRYTDNVNGTITDNNSGLLWCSDANLLATLNPSFDTDGVAGDGLVTWQRALDYIRKLNADAYLGFSDWRLPNINELASLVDLSKAGPSLPAGYPFVKVQDANSGVYWSSTTDANYPTESWVVALQGGGIRSSVNKSALYSVWPVRGLSYMSVSPSSLDLGSVAVGSNSSPTPVTISNAALAPDDLIVSSISVYGNDSASFGINPGDGTAGTCGTLTPVIAPGASCSVTVTFTPLAPGAKTGTLRIGSGVAASPVMSLPLAGTGVAPQYVVNIISGAHGTVAGSTSQLISYGANSTPVTAVPEAGYHFVGWTGTGGFVTQSSNPLTMEKVVTDQNITAVFAIDTFLVTPVATAHGTITPDTQQSVNRNDALTFTLAPTAGYYLSSVTGCGGSLLGNSYSTGGINSTCTVTATFSVIPDGIMVGDVISIADAFRALKIAVGLIAPSVSDLAHGDVAPLVNGKPQPDGSIDIGDAVVILRKAIGILSW